MAEKIRPPHMPSTTVPSQQPLLVQTTQTEGGQHGMSGPKVQQMGGGLHSHSHSPSQPDIALHARPASSTVAGSYPGPSLFVQPSGSYPGPSLVSYPSGSYALTASTLGLTPFLSPSSASLSAAASLSKDRKSVV